jgi:molybdate transport system substrate-binding protein
MKAGQSYRKARTTLFAGLLAVGVVSLPGSARAGEALAAVATNFVEVMETLAPKFETASGHRLRFAGGSTGKLYAQIVNGAPYDLFLAADQRRPELLAKSGAAVRGSRITYAVGRLALWSRDKDRLPADGAAYLRRAEFRHLALANPRLAPYGMAAKQTLEALGLWNRLRDRIVQGENIGQAFALVATGNAEVGFVALSAVVSPRNRMPGSRWDVPVAMYDPIRQDAVLLVRGEGNAAAGAFLDYIESGEARAIIAAFGYGAD